MAAKHACIIHPAKSEWADYSILCEETSSHATRQGTLVHYLLILLRQSGKLALLYVDFQVPRVRLLYCGTQKVGKCLRDSGVLVVVVCFEGFVLASIMSSPREERWCSCQGLV